MKKQYAVKVALAAVAMGMVGFVGNAQAVVNLDAVGGATPALFASEITVVPAGTTLTNAATALDVTAKFGFGASAGATRYVRVDLSGGAKFLAEPTYVIATGTDTTSVTGAGKSYVIFQVTAGGAGIAESDVATIAGGTFTVVDQTPVTVTVRQYETAGDAVAAGANALATATGSMISWKKALVVDATAVTPDKIDVTNQSTQFDDINFGSVTENIVGNPNVILETVPSTPLKAVGTTIAIADMIGAATLVVNGDFSATQDLTGGVADGTYTVANVWLDAALDCSGANTPATTLTGAAASFTLGAGAAIPAATVVCAKVNDVTAIAPGSFSAVYTPTPLAGYTVPATTLNAIGTWAKNGSTDLANLAMSPTTAFPSYIRISNPSSIEGNVYLTVWQNDGTSSGQFNLSAIAGQASNKLAGGASTTSISLPALYTASGLSAGYTGNLRIQVDAETSAIDLQNITISKDANIFSTY